ncbi:hypothetical protein BCR41DRAFT_356081 [Lobosporangium transversale]|uniref:Trypsin-like cysteine/serine peptidase domain-containing protein n=1 Tax=Lobosporangium transversale TaxID=64571 RepID=A0A1Y2GLA5_9FUNG|nr:hypothetical protein BCR41DRAFT_356081 [Lobosporangium transversale]ORZ12445.1 hypothetical protein BCR41DRAFT_356081 [Lobosporangium transversale]|eukprot:XP_021880064.1 hypothetical protein BCR41DRAFT_356081 [Lobosporangium transversale]
MFNHQKVHCGGGPEVVNEHDTATGLVKLGNYAPSDYILYEIVEHIPDAYDLYLAGWSALPEAPSARPRDHLSSAPLKSPWRNPRNHLRANHKGCIGDRRNDTVLGSRPMPTSTSEPGDPSLERLPIVGIHHPSGDSKKISFFFNGTLPKACWSECDLDDKKQYHWQIPKWSLGTTEPGSSGSPLFDANGRIVGQLHGGAASCFNRNGYDVYGAITDSFRTSPRIQDRLATYLDPDSTGRESMNGYSLASARHEAHKRQLR